MNDWKKILHCKKCEAKLDITCCENLVKCSTCKKNYPILIENSHYAIAESGTTQYYRHTDDGSIELRYFNNKPIDTLEEAFQDTYILISTEANPQKLLRAIKKYHDALKMSARRLIELNSDNLTECQKRKVLLDEKNNPEKSFNLRNIFYYLKLAFPQKATEIENCHLNHSSMIKKIWWVRNKIEHIHFSQWPVNAKIFKDLKKNPIDPDRASDHLTYEFLLRVNKTTIDAYLFLMSLRPKKPEKWQYDSVECFRIKKSITMRSA